MQNPCLRLLALVAAVLLPLAAASAQVRIIIDTDVATDCDDAGALAVAHALQAAALQRVLALAEHTPDEAGSPLAPLVASLTEAAADLDEDQRETVALYLDRVTAALRGYAGNVPG